jgi:hypothetical protein
MPVTTSFLPEYINQLPELTDVDPGADKVLVRDNSAGAVKAVLVRNVGNSPGNVGYQVGAAARLGVVSDGIKVGQVDHLVNGIYEDFASSGFIDVEAHVGRITIPENFDGVYQITGVLNFSRACPYERLVRVFVNGNDTGDYFYVPTSSASGNYPLMVIGYYGLDAGDYVELFWQIVDLAEDIFAPSGWWGLHLIAR